MRDKDLARDHARRMIDQALHDGPCAHPVTEWSETWDPAAPEQAVEVSTCGRVHFTFDATLATKRLFDRVDRLLCDRGEDTGLDAIFAAALAALLEARTRTIK